MLNANLIRRQLGWATGEGWRRLGLSHRSVRVDVVVDGEEVDSFVVADTRDLQQALAPVLRHLPVGAGRVRLTAVQEMRLPLGLLGWRREAELGNSGQALAFLDAGIRRAA